MSARNSAPSKVTRRPMQPIRPLPAKHTSPELLAVKAHRRRYKKVLPPRTGERGW